MLAQTCEPLNLFVVVVCMHVCGQGEQYHLEQGEREEGIDGPAQPQSAMIANQCRPGQKGKRGQIRHRLVRGWDVSGEKGAIHQGRKEARRFTTRHHDQRSVVVVDVLRCTGQYCTYRSEANARVDDSK